MDLGFFKLLDDDEHDGNAPAAADVDAFAAVLKGDLGGAAHAAAAAAYGVTRPGNGTVQPSPQSPATSVTTGHSSIKQVLLAPTATPSGQQQQLLWSQLSPEQQRELYQRRALQQRLQQQQQQQQQQQIQQQSQRPEHGSGAPGNRKGLTKEGISFTALMPLLQPHLPSEQGQQLAGLYQKFKRNEISREDFIRGARVIAGDQVLVQTILEMQTKQQARVDHQHQQQKLQQLQQQQQPQLQSQTQPHPQPSEPVSTQAPTTQQNVSASCATSTQPQPQQQQLSQEQTHALQQTLQPQTTQQTPQSQEPAVANAAQQRLPMGHPQAHPFQQAQVPPNPDLKAVPQGTQPQSHLSSSFPPTQLQSSLAKKGDRQQDPGQGRPPNSKTAVQLQLQQVKQEVDKSLAKQQSPSSTLPSIQPRPPPAVHQLQSTLVTGAGQPSQPYAQMGLPQQSIPSQPSGQVQLQQPQPVQQAPGPVTPQPQPAQPPPPQTQAQPEKPLTKYAKQKLRKEQKKREEEERIRKLAEEERLKKLMEEENLKKLQNTPSGTVMAVNQGLHPQHPQLSTPQLSSPQIDLNFQQYSHHPGSLSHQAQLQSPISQVDPQHVSIAPGGLVATGQGVSLIPVKQEPSDLQSDQQRQSFQLSKAMDLLPGPAGQKPAGQAQLSDGSVPPIMSASDVQVQGSNTEQVQMLSTHGSMLLPSPSVATDLAQQVEVVSMSASSLVPIPPLAGASGLQSTVPMKQIGGQQRTGSFPPVGPAGAASLHSVGSAAPSAGTSQVQATQPAATVSVPAVKTPSKKPAVGQKKSAESGPAQQPASKKQKVSAGEPDQSIDQLNDVTAVSGVNLKEEEEQLLIGPKEESRTTEAMRKIVQEEEERLFLERGPLRAKVAAIATRCGVKSVSEDVGRCLSMSVEERLRSMLYRLIKLSKQRCDVDKERHKIVVTSDVRRQILLMKRKAKEMLDKKLAEESERLRKLNEKKDKGSLPELEREELKAKAQKAQQEEEDRLKANAANVAARAAVGADDMLLKWQRMYEKGRQKRQGGNAGAAEEGAANTGATSAEGVSATHAEKKLENGDSTTAGPGKVETDSQGPPAASATGRPPGPGPGGATRGVLTGRRLLMSKSTRGERAITMKDVIAFLETEPQMSKSCLMYRLYERERKTGDGEKGYPGNRN